MKKLIIRSIQKEDYEKAHAFQCEYLDYESFDECVARMEANPGLYLTAFHEEELVGICYGHPSNRGESAINLQGIAVNLDESKSYARKGIGSALMKQFEKAVKEKGYHKIGLGCADDLKVEHFYLKNGFYPFELVAKSEQGEEHARVNVSDYARGKGIQEQLRQKYKPKEVIFIFEKQIG